MSDPDTHSDPRTAATATIAGCTVGALAVTLIFGRSVSGGIILPLLVVGGAAAAIAAVWKYGGRKVPESTKEVLDLRARVADLEERLGAAETVEAFEDRLAAKEAALRIESTDESSDPTS